MQPCKIQMLEWLSRQDGTGTRAFTVTVFHGTWTIQYEGLVAYASYGRTLEEAIEKAMTGPFKEYYRK